MPRIGVLVMPKGAGFVEYPVFEHGYEALKAATKSFTELEPEKVFSITVSNPIQSWCCVPYSVLHRLNGLSYKPKNWDRRDSRVRPIT